MAKAIKSMNGYTYGFANFPIHGDRLATVKEMVHDGDTVNVEADGSFGIRFLGIDTAEVSFVFPELPNDNRAKKFLPIRHFNEYLTDPFSNIYPDSTKFKNDLGDDLIDHLSCALGSMCANNHEYHAEKAHRYLEDLIQSDVTERINECKEFRFFMAFTYEVMDYYGRFLCYLHRDDTSSEREYRKSYNEWMLEAGMACPYFIWPNVNPFRTKPTLEEAVPPIGQLRKWLQKDKTLNQARKFISDARNNHQGIFENNNPLLLMPFELRFLSRRCKPSRYILDLSKNDAKLLKPIDYHKIKNLEDRLFIPSQFVPLFKEIGYDILD